MCSRVDSPERDLIGAAEHSQSVAIMTLLSYAFAATDYLAGCDCKPIGPRDRDGEDSLIPGVQPPLARPTLFDL